MTLNHQHSFQNRVSNPSQPLISGEVQFWRMPPEHWKAALEAVKATGITDIATYLSWRRHEPTRGDADLRGRHGANLDVHRFLRLCADLELTVQLKPGPWICAEERGGGIPDWLLDNSELIALDHTGRHVSGYNPPFKHPMPSYASAAFRLAVSEWITFVWDDLAEFADPGGPIVATQLDNEPSLGFQDSMYGFDYHPESVAAFQRFVLARHGSLEATANAWERPIGSSSEIQPPHPNDPRITHQPLARHERDWIDYQQFYIADYLAWLQQINHRAGVGHLVDFVNLNTHPVRGMPQSGAVITTALKAAAPLAVVGEDHYFEPPIGATDVAGLALAAAQGIASGTSLVWAPEIQSGIWRSPGEHVEYPDPTDHEIAAWWGASLALGYQGFNLYMLVNRENWEFAPISAAGQSVALAEHVAALMRTVSEMPNLARYRPIPQVNLIWDREALGSAYRVRGTQSAPDTAWDAPNARAGYDATVAAAAELTGSGIHFRLCQRAEIDPTLPTIDAAESSYAGALEPLVTAHATGLLARLHRAPDGHEVLYLVAWQREAPVVNVELRFADDTIDELRLVGAHEHLPVVGGRVVIPRVVAGLNLYQVMRQGD